MHLPWKKHRISQLVADLHSPSNRGGSLVVQTGFPASLVDLFVKNRDRLRKTSLKKRCNRRGIDFSDLSLTHSTPPAIPVTTRPPISTEGAAVVGRPNGAVEAPEVAGDESYANSVFVVVLKTFVVVAMALSTKKLVFGITLSAFVLLLLEYAGMHVDVDVGVFLKPERLLDLIRWKKALTRLKNGNASKILPEIAVSQDSVVEIERVGADLSCGNAKNEDKGEEALLFCNNNSRSRRVKSIIIRRFVPKKLRSSNNKKKSEELEEDKEESSERSSYLRTDGHEFECGNNEYDEESKTSKAVEKVGIAREGNSGCLVMLVLIVLVGLFGGRILALVLTLVWFLVLRFVANARAYESVPMVRFLVSI